MFICSEDGCKVLHSVISREDIIQSGICEEDADTIIQAVQRARAKDKVECANSCDGCPSERTGLQCGECHISYQGYD